MQADFIDIASKPEHRTAALQGPAVDTGQSAWMPSLAPMIALLLDELDYGVILLRDTTQVVHLNNAARAEVRAGRSVAIVNGALCARRAADAPALCEALTAAAARGLRRLVTLDAEGGRVAVALIPLGAASAGGLGLTAAVFGRRRLCERISVQCFARAHDLTPAESNVFELLCEGLDPGDIAEVNEVGMATVRTQVNNIRGKIGASSIRDLIQRAAVLPPIVSSLRD